VECVGDELKVHVWSALHGGLELSPTRDSNQQLPFTCGHLPEAGTSSFYDGGSYRMLFWSLPEPGEGLERILPIPWPRWEKLMASMLEGTRPVNHLVVEELTSHGFVTLSIDVAMFYRSLDGKTKLLTVAREDLDHIYNTEEEGGLAVTSLARYSILPLYFGPVTSKAFFLDEKEDSFRSIFSRKLGQLSKQKCT
jgi:hypothetical protein